MRRHLALVGLRPLLTAGSALVLLPAIAGALLIGPWAPWALERADTLAITGRTDRAIAAYERVGTFNFSAEDRAEALYRGALVAGAEGGQHERAVALLARLAEDHPNFARTPEALARMGAMLGNDLGAPARGVDAYLRAVEAAPRDPAAPEWLLEAANLAELAGSRQQAWLLRQRATEQFPELAPRAWSAMARMKLRGGDAPGASALYQQVMASGYSTPQDIEVATLGLSFCLEDMGQHEAAAAVAELDDESPELAQRRERVIGRNEARVR